MVYALVYSNEWRYRLLRHSLFWVCMFIYNMLPLFERRVGRLGTLGALVTSSADAGLFMVIDILFCYLTLYYIIPNTLLQKRFWSFIAFFILVAFVYGFLRNFYWENYIIPLRSTMGFLFSPNRHFITAVTLSGPFFITAGMASFILLAKYWYFSQQENLQLQRGISKFRENLTKSLEQPHFLLDLLDRIKRNNLVFTNKKDEIMQRLSSLISYSIHQSDRRWIALRSEIESVTEYLAIEKVLNEKAVIDFIYNKAEVANRTIAPMLLIPFIENVFAGFFKANVKDAWMKINLHVVNSQLNFQISSAKPETALFLSEYKSSVFNTAIARLSQFYPKACEHELSIESEHVILTLLIDLDKSV